MKRSLPWYLLALSLAFAAPAFAKEEKPAAKPAAAKPAAEKKADAATAESTTPPVALHYGKADAPILVEEYASLSCSHCAHFHKDVLPKVKKALMDSGKARLVTYSYIRNEPDLRGTMLLHCLENEEQRQQFAGVLFEMQDKWAYAENVTGALGDIAKVGGIGPEKFEACVKDTALETALMKDLQHTTDTRKIEGTPTFFINGTKYTGSPEAEALIKAITEAPAAAKAEPAKVEEKAKK